MFFSCKKGEFDRCFDRLDRPVEESRPDRQPDRPVDPTSFHLCYSHCHAKTHCGAGGIAIYIKIPFKFEIQQDLQFIMSGCENLWIDFAKSKINLIVGVVHGHQFDDKSH